ncbi:hypothetical protein NE619_01770 [Anaerovorax odorimutans]|uniref:Tocopherol cyclase n=1 Tax=Anaerovorax odorimutans TaxID=109327 RepID=A0ABT1RJV2_9FIRM|nr:tocopherol cyclase family protein [Anaerovorax odorimutans]MCQ4635445.1 hypothetical protein [Anaerovorax odorimutans]
MSHFHGNGKHSAYFEGWYFKQTGEDGTAAFIPAFHINADGRKWASLQVITQQTVFDVEYSAQEFHAAQSRFLVELGMCRFSRAGCRLEIKSGEHKVTGILNFEEIKKPKYDIMGPFALVPFMECRHKVISLHHRVEGQLLIDGKKYRFQQGLGYIEGDRGKSFPRGYCWTQCYFTGGSIMLSVAEIPFAGRRFIGCVGFIYLNGKEHRLATYLGVKLHKVTKEEIRLSQGNIQMTVRLIEEDSKPLKAPRQGSMDRIIHESLTCTVFYEVRKNGKTLLELYSQNAGFEWDM